MRSSSKAIVAPVVSQHADDAAMYWLLRDGAVHAPHFSLRRLGILESRLDGYLDGLRIAGDVGWILCRERLRLEEPGEIFSAAVLAFESHDPARIVEVLAIAATAPELARALAAAFGWLPWHIVERHAESLIRADEPLIRRAAVGAFAVQRQDPAEKLRYLLADSEAVVRARAFRAVGELARKDLDVDARRGLVDSDEDCRLWAAISLTLLGDTNAIENVRAVVEAGHPRAEYAACLAARAMAVPQALAWQCELASSERTLRLAVQTAGAIGDPASVPWLVDQMDNLPVARVAGEAFTKITGIDLAYHDLEAQWPQGFESGPNDDPLDESILMDADEHLPFPDRGRVAAWWSQHRVSFRPGIRYLSGEPISASTLDAILRRGRQRLRAAAALELALRQPAHPLFEVRAPVGRQRASLGL
jgi:uncharacterized protein (TIGR02270 family)